MAIIGFLTLRPTTGNPKVESPPGGCGNGRVVRQGHHEVIEPLLVDLGSCRGEWEELGLLGQSESLSVQGRGSEACLKSSKPQDSRLGCRDPCMRAVRLWFLGFAAKGSGSRVEGFGGCAATFRVGQGRESGRLVHPTRHLTLKPILNPKPLNSHGRAPHTHA